MPDANDMKTSAHPKTNPPDVPSFDTDDIDEELLALAPPPPSLQQAAITVLVMVLSIVILVLFFPDLRFFLRSFQSAEALGESADIDLQNVNPESWVSLTGIPLMNRTLTFSDGAKFVSRDIYRKMAPLSGRPELLVQWRIEKPSATAAEPTISAPSYFEGRLRRREDMGNAYDKFWPFYDCLTMHNASRCQYCLGRDSYASCRDAFTCVENFPVALCAKAIDTDLATVSAEIDALKKQAQHAAANSYERAELANLENLQNALLTVQTEGRITRLEEVILRLEHLAIPESEFAQIQELLSQALSLQIAVLGARLSASTERVQSLGEAARAELDDARIQQQQADDAIDALQKEVAQLTHRKAICDTLRHVASWATELRQKVLSPDAPQAALAQPLVDPHADNGAVILDALTALNAQFTGASGQANEASAAPATSEPANAPDTRRDNWAQSLNALSERLTDLSDRIDALASAAAPDFDRWAGRRDIYTEVPESQRLSSVFVHLTKIESFLDNAAPADAAPEGATDAADIALPSGEAASANDAAATEDPIDNDAVTPLPQRLEEAQKALQQQRDIQKRLREMNVLTEYTLDSEFNALVSAVKAPPSPAWKKQVLRDWSHVMGRFASQEFYPRRLSDHPKIKARIDALLTENILTQLETQTAEREKRWQRPMWILMDRERPTDNPWVVLVYILVPLMFFLNARRLHLFLQSRRR
jgi:hypothetical protein